MKSLLENDEMMKSLFFSSVYNSVTMSEMSKQLLRFLTARSRFLFLHGREGPLLPHERAKRSSVRFCRGRKARRQCQPPSACAHALRSATL